MVTITAERLKLLAPHALPACVEAFEHQEPALAEFGITTVLRFQHFLAQALHETQGFRHLEENLSYSAGRLRQVWPSRFPSDEVAAAYARNPIALANRVYGCRLGNHKPMDGWTYRGRGIFQLTGRDNYRRIGFEINRDLEKNPGDVMKPEFQLLAAAAFWDTHGCSEPADADDIRSVTKLINGGYNGLADRTAWLAKVREVMGTR